MCVANRQAAHNANDSLSQLLWLLSAIHPTNNPSCSVDNGRLMSEVTPFCLKQNKYSIALGL